MKVDNGVLVKDIILGRNSRGPLKDAELGKLVSSMENQGLLQPIGLYKPAGQKKYTLVYGNRRFKAAKILGWKQIPAVVHNKLDTAKGEDLLQNASENWVRSQPSLAEQAKIFDQLLKLGMTQKDIAARSGIAPTIVEKCMRTWQNLPKHIQQHVRIAKSGAQRKGVIPVTVADAVVTLQSRKNLNKSQVDKIYKHLLNNAPSAEDIHTMDSLIANGMNVEKAIQTSEKIRVITVRVKVDYPKLLKLVKRRGFNGTTQEFVTSIIARSKDFPIVNL